VCVCASSVQKNSNAICNTIIIGETILLDRHYYYENRIALLGVCRPSNQRATLRNRFLAFINLYVILMTSKRRALSSSRCSYLPLHGQ